MPVASGSRCGALALGFLVGCGGLTTRNDDSGVVADGSVDARFDVDDPDVGVDAGDAATDVDAGSGCPQDRALCDGACVDLNWDPGHCGACGAACSTGRPCVAGRCDESLRSWATPERVDEDPRHGMAPEVAINDDGVSVVVWRQPAKSDRFGVWAARFDSADGAWGAPAVLDAAEDHVTTADVVLGNDDQATVLWSQTADGDEGPSPWAARFDPRPGAWQPGVVLEGEPGYAFSLGLAGDRYGNALAAWQQYEPSLVTRIWAARFDRRASSWSVKQGMQSSSGAGIGPDLAMTRSGRAATTWVENQRQVWVNRFDPDRLEWTGAEPAFTTDADVSGLEVNLVESGDLFLVWHFAPCCYWDAWAAHYDARRGVWSEPFQLVETQSTCGSPKVETDGHESAIAVFSCEEEEGMNILVAPFDPETRRWEKAEVVDTVARAGGRVVAMDAAGNATLVWIGAPVTDSSLPQQIWASRYAAASRTWSASEQVHASEDKLTSPDIAMNAAGMAVLAWEQRASGAKGTIWATRLE